MAQLPYKVQLQNKTCITSVRQFARTVIMPEMDATPPAGSIFDSADKVPDGKPEIYYMENVMPTLEGVRSVAYRDAGDSVNWLFPGGHDVRVMKSFPTRKWSEGGSCVACVAYDVTDGLAYVMILARFPSGPGYAYGYLHKSPSIGVTPSFGVVPYDFVLFNVQQVAYYALIGLTYHTSVAPGVTPFLFTGLDGGAVNPVYFIGIADGTIITAICTSFNYIIFTDNAGRLYWSSAINPLDFTPSVATGAGSGMPSNVRGAIQSLRPVLNGFAIYSEENIVIAQWSGNIQYPWIFKEAVNSSGVISTDHICEGPDGTNYAWTSAGMLQVTNAGCKQVFSEITMFLTSRIYETFNNTTKNVDYVVNKDDFNIKLSYVSNRFFCISYANQLTGVHTLVNYPVTYQYVLVYDTVLKRWGKLKVAHNSITQLIIPFQPFLNSGYTLGGAGTSYDSANIQPDIHGMMMFLSQNGEPLVAEFSYDNILADAVLIMGQYSISRTKLTTIEEVDVQVVNSTNNDFNLNVISSFNGRDEGTPFAAPLINTGATTRKYGVHKTGENHSLVIQGSFDLNTVILKAVPGGNR